MNESRRTGGGAKRKRDGAKRAAQHGTLSDEARTGDVRKKAPDNRKQRAPDHKRRNKGGGEKRRVAARPFEKGARPGRKP